MLTKEMSEHLVKRQIKAFKMGFSSGFASGVSISIVTVLFYCLNKPQNKNVLIKE